MAAVVAAQPLPAGGSCVAGTIAASASAPRSRKRCLDACAASAGGFSAASFAVSVCKRLRTAREALRADILEAAAAGRAGAPEALRQLAKSGAGAAPSCAASAASAPAGRFEASYFAPGRRRFAFAPLLDAGDMDGLPPEALAVELMRPLGPPPAPPASSLSHGPELLWQVSSARRRAYPASCGRGLLPLWTGPPSAEASAPRSQPLSYLEYQHWLQRVVPSAELRPAPKDDLAEGKPVEEVSGLELLRRLCRAAAPPKARRRLAPALTPEEVELAESSLYGDGHPDEVLVSRFSVDLTRGQLQCLRPKTWLNDEVINFYYKLLQERSRKAKAAPRCWFTNSFFWNKLSGGPAKSNDEYNYKEVRRWTVKAKVDIFQHDYVIFPMNIGEMHWAMGAIDLKRRGFRYFDSMISRPHPNFVPFLRRYLEDEHKAKKGGPLPDAAEWDLLPLQVPQQRNSYDCGVFTCCFAEYFSAGQDLEFDQEDMGDLRLRLAARVVKGDEDW